MPTTLNLISNIQKDIHNQYILSIAIKYNSELVSKTVVVRAKGYGRGLGGSIGSL